jgi:hypothetical protein
VVYSLLEDKQYDSLENAMTIGGYLLLLRDIEETYVVATKETVLDLYGHTISNGTEQNLHTVIVNGGDLTIVDNSPSKAGAITNDSDTDAKPSSVYVSNGGTLTLEDGTVSGYKCAIYCDENSSVKINGGKVIGKGSVGMALTVYSGSTLEVNGGHIMSENTNS